MLMLKFFFRSINIDTILILEIFSLLIIGELFNHSRFFTLKIISDWRVFFTNKVKDLITRSPCRFCRKPQCISSFADYIPLPTARHFFPVFSQSINKTAKPSYSETVFNGCFFSLFQLFHYSIKFFHFICTAYQDITATASIWYNSKFLIVKHLFPLLWSF